MGALHDRKADAWLIVGVHDDASYLLHWIESHARNHADALLHAINEWADEEGFDGSLVCRPELIPLYQRHGWYTAELWHGDMVVMKRAASPPARPAP